MQKNARTPQEDIDSCKGDGKPSENTSGKGRRRTLTLFFGTIVSPVEGFKRLKSARLTPETFNASVFFPLLALAAVANFMSLVYYPDQSLSDILRHAIGTFLAFFITYFAVFPLMRLTSNAEAAEKFNTPYGRQYVSCTLSTIVIYYILYTLLPILEPLLFFAPLYTVYMVTKSIRTLRLPQERELRSIISLSIVEVFLPLFIEFCFNAITPDANPL